MADPTPERIAQIRDWHTRTSGALDWDGCDGCTVHWPCDAALLLAHIDALEARNARDSERLQHIAKAIEALERRFPAKDNKYPMLYSVLRQLRKLLA